nr:hypothetical protein pLIS51_00211c [Listeria seeligeri]
MVNRKGPLRNGGGGWSEERALLFFFVRGIVKQDFSLAISITKKSLALDKAFISN